LADLEFGLLVQGKFAINDGNLTRCVNCHDDVSDPAHDRADRADTNGEVVAAADTALPTAGLMAGARRA